MSYILVAVGLASLVLGGELLVRGAVALAARAGVSPLLIGLTLVGFGTSTPELAASVTAALDGSPGIALGNVVGSNIANILLIVGLAALLRPLVLSPAAGLRDGVVMLLAGVGCLVVVLGGTVGRADGFVLVACLAGYVALIYRQERRAKPDDASPGASSPVAIACFAGGLVLVLLGANLLVSGAIDLARAFGVSEIIVGLTLVALGTSLPELATSLVATVRRQPDVALGNVLGSNIFNVLGILGITAIITPLEVPARIATVDVWVMLAGSAALLGLLWFAARVGRGAGAAMLVAYATYVAAMALA
ncbi:MAG: calcium/sodium antiporter [Alphaproteobacteria bacterium]